MKSSLILLVSIVFLSSCISTGAFETAHTLPAGESTVTVIPFWEINLDDEPLYFDSAYYFGAQALFNIGLDDRIELDIQTDIIFLTNISLKLRLTDISKPFAFAAGPSASFTPFISTFFNIFNYSPVKYAIMNNVGLVTYSSYRWNNFIAFANIHGVYYLHNSLFIVDNFSTSNYGFGANTGIIKYVANDKMGFGFQFSVEKLGDYYSAAASLGIIYRMSRR